MGKRYSLTMEEHSKIVDIAVSITIAYLTRIEHPSNTLKFEWDEYKRLLIEWQRKMWNYFYK